MGTFLGHILPGTFFLIFAIWWSFITSIRYIQSKQRSSFKKKELVGYRSTTTMPCICLPCNRLKRAPIESYLKAIFGTIGLIGEFVTGISYGTTNQISNDHISLFDCDSEHTSHKRHAGHMQTNSTKNEQLKFFFANGNTQHMTMYASFTLASIVEILIYHRIELPKRFEHIFNTMALIIEALLFAFHLHSRAPLDVHLHFLLFFSICGCILFCILEIYDQNQIMFTYGRILCIMLQGTWFYQTGFILYPPFDASFLKWNRCDHNQIMLITMSFCWHIILITMGLLIQMWIMKRFYYSSKYLRSKWDELIIIDDELFNNNMQSWNSSNNKCVLNDIENDRLGVKFLSLNSEDDDEDNCLVDRMDLDTFKMNSYPVNETKNNSNKNIKNDNTSSTSGNYSYSPETSCCSETIRQ